MGYSVLFVDDDEDTRVLIDRALRLHGYEVILAADSFEALEAITVRKFDAYLLDNWLPDLSGVELCAKLRKQYKDTPILLLSGAGREIDKAEAISAGANGYLTKPFDIDELASCLQSLITHPEMLESASWLSGLDDNDGAARMSKDYDQLKVIAQGVINSLFAKKQIKLAPVVRRVASRGTKTYLIQLNHSPVSVLEVALNQDQFFSEAVRNQVLRHFGVGVSTTNESFRPS